MKRTSAIALALAILIAAAAAAPAHAGQPPVPAGKVKSAVAASVADPSPEVGTAVAPPAVAAGDKAAKAVVEHVDSHTSALVAPAGTGSKGDTTGDVAVRTQPTAARLGTAPRPDARLLKRGKPAARQ